MLANDASCDPEKEEKTPPKDPIGVLTALTITAVEENLCNYI